MSSRFALTADDCEILVARELRRAGIEPSGLRRRRGSYEPSGDGWRFELAGALEAYGSRWSACVSCRNTAGRLGAADVDDARLRADHAHARSALLFTTGSFDADAIERAHGLRVALFEIVDAQPALLAAGLIQPGPLPAWVPEFTAELITRDDRGVRRRLLEANEPELILRELRRLH